MLFGYDHMVDVKNVTEHTLTGLEEGKKYYVAATAYDDDQNESAYSDEIMHTFSVDPAAPINLKGFRHIPAPEELKTVDKSSGPIIKDGKIVE
jgi:hypothetical protein